MRIKQSHHGTGGRKGYKYRVYDDYGRYHGQLNDVPIECRVGSTIKIDERVYKVKSIYKPEALIYKKDEVVFYELEEYVFKPDFDLEYLYWNAIFARGVKEVASELMYIENENGDWCGIYVDNRLQIQGHSIPHFTWIELINTFQLFSEAKVYEISDFYLDEIGDLPDNFTDINISELSE